MRLSNYERDEMIKAIICDTMKDEYKAIAVERARLAEAIWCEFTPQEVRNNYKAGYFPEEEHIQISLDTPGNVYDQLHFNGYFGFHGMYLNDKPAGEQVYRQVKYSQKGGCYVKLQANHLAFVLVEKSIDAKKEFEKKHNSARDKIKAVLYSVSSTEKLLEVWPEARPYIRNPPVKSLPVLPIAAINAMLGLPVS